jgi:exodeoxyribonuclease VII large subunit
VPARQSKLHALERHLNAQTPQQRLAQRLQRLAALRSQLVAASRYYARPSFDRVSRLRESFARLQLSVLRSPQDRLRHLETKLNALDPQAPLARGYAIVTFNGKAVRDAASVPEGAIVKAQVQRGKIVARVEGKEL